MTSRNQCEVLLEELRSLRSNLARADNLPEQEFFKVFSNRTLQEMARIRPMTQEEMLAINGVGPVKMKRYGWDFLRVIQEHVGTDAKQQNPQPSANHQSTDPRQRYPAEYRTSDGHYVRSRAEVMIDDWLFNRHIAHAYERKLPVEEDALCDFYLPQGNVYIEFWGKEDDPAYVRRMQKKQQIYKRHNLRLISLTDAELYRLDDHMPSLLRQYGVNVT